MSSDSADTPQTLSIQLEPEVMAKINTHLQEHPDQILLIPELRQMIAANRIQKLKPEEIFTTDNQTPSSVDNVIKYNVEGLKGMWALGRPALLINPLGSCSYIGTRMSGLDVLTVGPRTEAEIFALMAVGFNSARIRGLDLISYSPFVDVGDMHDMPYTDNSYDVVILGWVLAYSTDNPKVVAEVLRVARPGAFIAVGCEYNPLSNEEVNAQLEKEIDTEMGTDMTRFDKTEEILDLFEGHVDSVVFRHDVHPSMRAYAGAIMVIFQLPL